MGLYFGGARCDGELVRLTLAARWLGYPVGEAALPGPASGVDAWASDAAIPQPGCGQCGAGGMDRGLRRQFLLSHCLEAPVASAPSPGACLYDRGGGGLEGGGCKRGRRGKRGRGGGWRLETANASGARSAKAWLSSTAADAVLLQEHGVWSAEALRRLRVWSQRNGWDTVAGLAAPPCAGVGKGSGGVMVAVRRRFARARVLAGTRDGVIHPGRAVGMWSDIAMRGGLSLMSVYLYVGLGLGYRDSPYENANWLVLAALAAAVQRCSSPWVLAGDWNLSPEALEASGWVDNVGGLVIRPNEHTRLAGSGSCIDFFVVDKRLAPFFGKAEVVHGATIKTHRPVDVVLASGARRAHAWQLRRPKRFPVERAIGPCVDLDDGELPAGAEDSLQTWYASAERQLRDMHDIPAEERDAYCGRADGPRYVWAPVLGQPGSAYPRSSEAGRRLREAAELAHDVHHAVANGLHASLGQRRELLLRKLRACGHVVAAEHSADAQAAARSVEAPRTYALWRLLDRLALAEEDAADRASGAQFREWVIASLTGGARPAHRFSKVPVLAGAVDQPRPAAARLGGDEQLSLCAGTEPLVGPAAALEEELVPWEVLWAVKEAPAAIAWPPIEPLPDLAADELTEAAGRFKRRTGLGTDTFHPRRVKLLTPALQRRLASLITGMERSADIPAFLWHLLMLLIPKDDGGQRPIGLLTAPLRLWAKARRKHVWRWEREHARDYFWSDTDKPSERCAWHQLAVDEACDGTGLETAAILADIVKCFENVPRDVLVEEARATAFPLAILRLALCTYRAARRLICDGFCSREVRATRSILAGCVHATSLLRCLLLRTLDRISARWTGVTLRVVVDDVTAQLVGTRRQITHRLPLFARDFAAQVQGGLRLPISAQKTCFTASAPATLRVLKKRLKALGWKGTVHAKLLGVDYAPGRGRRVGVRRRGLGRFEARQPRFSMLRRAGAQVLKLAKTGGLPSIRYGDSAIGASDADLDRARRLVASTAGCAGGGRSHVIAMMLKDARSESGSSKLDPIFSFTTGVVHALAQEVWSQHLPLRLLDRSVRHQSRRLATSTRPWRLARGPAAATILTLRRIGWSMPSARAIADEFGTVIDLVEHGPRDVATLVDRGVQRYLCRWVAAYLGQPQLSDGITLKPLARIIDGSLGGLAPRLRGALRSTVEGGQWPQQRLAAAGLADANVCRRCELLVGTLLHRHMDCPATAAHRHQCLDWEVAAGFRRAQRSGAPLVFCSRLLAPCLDAFLPPPLSELVVVWKTASTCFHGDTYVDGSGVHNRVALRRRCGGGAVSWSASGGLTVAAAFNLPGALQSVPGAEYFAVYFALLHCLPPLTIFTDHANVLTCVERGRVWATGYGRPFAALWARIFDLLEDVGSSNVTFTKVQAHMSARRAVQLGLEHLREGNDRADALAKEGAALHPVHDGLIEAQERIEARVESMVLYVAGLHRHLSGDTEAAARDASALPRHLRPRVARSKRSRRLGWRGPDEGGHSPWWDQERCRWACARCQATTASRCAWRRARCWEPFAARIAPAQHARPPTRRRMLWRVADFLF